MEGKESRYGPASSGLFAASTTDTSTGAVNAAHDSFTPLGAWCRSSTSCSARVSRVVSAPAFYGMLVFALLSVFIAGLMVGRTPSTSARRSRRPR